jgi:hypothetical protein
MLHSGQFNEYIYLQTYKISHCHLGYARFFIVLACFHIYDGNWHELCKLVGLVINMSAGVIENVLFRIEERTRINS